MTQETLILEQLIEAFKKLPGIGTKTATRLSHFILRQPSSFAEELAGAILQAKRNLVCCKGCFTFSQEELCPICRSPKRDTRILCVVEEVADVEALEKSGQFQGRYHILHGVISPLDHIDEGKLRIRELLDRVAQGGIEEVILATNPTVEGDTTALYIARLLKYNNVKLSRIAHGIPVGAEIEYLDGATLSKAIQNRVLM